MTRRKLIWALVTFVVALTIGMFLLGRAHADVPSPSPQAPPIPPDPTAADAFGDYGFAFIILALVIYHLIVGLWKASRVVRRAATWVRSRPPDNADEKTVDEHADEAMTMVSPADVTATETQLCNEIWALPEVAEPTRRTP